MTPDPLLGRTLDGRFRLDARIGAGGMGAVYRARQLNVDRDVAVKLLHPLIAAEPDLVRRFRNEAKIIARLRDPHTLKLIDFGQADDGSLYLVTEFLEGRGLDAVLQERGRLGVEETLRLLRQICDALAEAHDAGVVHRDLKPANLFLERLGGREVVKVLDFGIARWSSAGGDATTGPLHGTPEYMAPEQARGERVDARCDLYSLGALAYECLAGAPVFRSETAMGLLLKHLQEIPTPFDQRQPPVEAQPAVEALVMQLLAKAPDDRPPTARALAAALDALLGEGSVAPPQPPARRATWWPVAVAALAAAGLAAWLLRPVGAGAPTAPPAVVDASPALVDASNGPADTAPTVAAAPDAGAVDAAPPDASPRDAAAKKTRRRRSRAAPKPADATPGPPPRRKDGGLPPGFIRVVPKPHER